MPEGYGGSAMNWTPVGELSPAPWYGGRATPRVHIAITPRQRSRAMTPSIPVRGGPRQPKSCLRSKATPQRPQSVPAGAVAIDAAIQGSAEGEVGIRWLDEHEEEDDDEEIIIMRSENVDHTGAVILKPGRRSYQPSPRPVVALGAGSPRPGAALGAGGRSVLGACDSAFPQRQRRAQVGRSNSDRHAFDHGGRVVPDVDGRNASAIAGRRALQSFLGSRDSCPFAMRR